MRVQDLISRGYKLKSKDVTSRGATLKREIFFVGEGIYSLNAEDIYEFGRFYSPSRIYISA